MKVIASLIMIIIFFGLTGCTSSLIPKKRTLTIGGGAMAGAAAGYAVGKKTPLGTAIGAIGGALVTDQLFGSDPSELQEAFNQGYAQSSGDAIRRHYWLKQYNERAGEDMGRMAYYSIPASNWTEDGRELVDHNVVVPIIE